LQLCFELTAYGFRLSDWKRSGERRKVGGKATCLSFAPWKHFRLPRHPE
jgi:hypothetical protein